jgi:hypothetical protein
MKTHVIDQPFTSLKKILDLTKVEINLLAEAMVLEIMNKKWQM